MMKSQEKKINISLNIINFMFYAGIGCIVPFLSVHMRSLGLTLWNCVCVQVASGLTCLLIPLVIGSLAERKSHSPSRYHYKLTFSTSLLVATIAYCALLAVPRILRTPRQPLIDFDCSSSLSAVINIEKCANWPTCSDVAAAWSSSGRFRISHCRYTETIQLVGRSDKPKNENVFSVHPIHMCFRSTEDTTNLCLVYDPHLREDSGIEFRSDLASWHYTEYRNVSASEFLPRDHKTTFTSMDICSFRPATSGTTIRISGHLHDSVFCRSSPEETSEDLRCLLSIQAEGKGTPCYEVVGDPSFTFWLYLGLRVIADAFLITSLCLLEGVTLRVVQAGPYRCGAYGMTRLWPALALMFTPLPMGALVDYYSGFSGVLDYSPPYFVFAGFELIVFALIFALPLPVGGNTYRYTVSPTPITRSYDEESNTKIGLTVELFVTFLMTLCLGTAWSISQVFDPWLYQDIGFNHLLLGAMSSLGFVGALPFLLVSKNLLQNIGEANLVATAFAFHSIHLAGLSFIEEWYFWWWALPFEAMEAFTIAIAWIALVALVEQGNSKGRRIALHYVLVVTQFALGRIVGCSINGLLTEYFSSSISYRVFSIFCLIMAVFYLCLHHLYLKPRHKKKMAARRSTQRLSVNGSCLQLVERRPVNGGQTIMY